MSCLLLKKRHRVEPFHPQKGIIGSDSLCEPEGMSPDQRPARKRGCSSCNSAAPSEDTVRTALSPRPATGPGSSGQRVDDSPSWRPLFNKRVPPELQRDNSDFGCPLGQAGNGSDVACGEGTTKVIL